MQERRSLFYTLEEIDTMKDVKKLETTYRNIIIDTLYLRTVPDNNGSQILLYPCNSDGTLLTSGFFVPNSDAYASPNYVLLQTDCIKYYKSSGSGSYPIYSSRLWIDTGGVYYYLSRAFPIETYGKMYMPLKVPYLKYKSGTSVSSSMDVYYKEYEP